MKIFGIFGDPIEHSLSPAMQNAALRAMGLDACYIAFRVPPQGLKDALLGAAAMGFGGLNLTIPLKEQVLELDILQPDELARAIGAVNTVSFGPQGRMAGPGAQDQTRLRRPLQPHGELRQPGSGVQIKDAGATHWIAPFNRAATIFGRARKSFCTDGLRMRL